MACIRETDLVGVQAAMHPFEEDPAADLVLCVTGADQTSPWAATTALYTSFEFVRTLTEFFEQYRPNLEAQPRVVLDLDSNIVQAWPAVAMLLRFDLWDQMMEENGVPCLERVELLYRAAVVYGMEAAEVYLREKVLTSDYWLRHDPVQVYAIARICGLAKECCRAARMCLELRREDWSAPQQLREIRGLDDKYQELDTLYRNRSVRLSNLFRETVKQTGRLQSLPILLYPNEDHYGR